MKRLAGTQAKALYQLQVERLKGIPQQWARAGDRIVELNGLQIDDWEALG